MQSDLFNQTLAQIKEKKLPGLNLGEDVIFPNYQGNSLQNIPGSVCRWLDIKPFGAPPLSNEILEVVGGPYQNVILLLVDGLGLNLFKQILAGRWKDIPGAEVWNSLLEESVFTPLTSVIPSTTSAALTTLWTGRAPSEHGVLGYEVWLKEFGMIANMIYHAPASSHGSSGTLAQSGFSSQTFLPVQTLGPHLVQNGVQPFAFLHSSIARSGLSTMHLPDVKLMPYRSTSDCWVTLRQTLKMNPRMKTYSYVYWSEVDSLSHLYGPEDERVIWEFASFSLQLQRFLEEMQSIGTGKTLFVMLADHGQVTTPVEDAYSLVNHPEFLSHLIMVPTCENRLPFLYVRSGHEEAVKNYMNQAWPGKFTLLPGKQVLQAGLFGDGYAFPSAADRVGDYVVFPKDSAYLWWAGKINPLLGRHGGLNPDEMLIPFIAKVL